MHFTDSFTLSLFTLDFDIKKHLSDYLLNKAKNTNQIRTQEIACKNAQNFLLYNHNNHKHSSMPQLVKPKLSLLSSLKKAFSSNKGIGFISFHDIPYVLICKTKIVFYFI